MVERVSAYKAADGTLFGTRVQARGYDARLAIVALLGPVAGEMAKDIADHMAMNTEPLIENLRAIYVAQSQGA